MLAPLRSQGRVEEAKDDGGTTQWLRHPCRESVEFFRIHMHRRGLRRDVLVCHWTGLQEDLDTGWILAVFQGH